MSAEHQVAPKPFVVPCADLPLSAPLRWLQLGWQDLRRAPGLTAIFGLVIALVSVVISIMAWSLGRFALLATLLSGFVFVAPLIGVGLYCVSRELEAGERPALAHSFTLARRVVGQAAVFALAQLVVLLVWSRAGMMVSAFVPLTPRERWRRLSADAAFSRALSTAALRSSASVRRPCRASAAATCNAIE